jgi:two-component system nitrate/nitrite sensor histidine kinase NarX
MAASVVAAVVYIFVRFFARVLQESALELAWVREQAAVAVERQRIARETHDSIAQTLFYLTVELSEVEDLVLAGQKEEAHNKLQVAREQIRATHHKVKEVIRDLKQQAELEDFAEAVRRTATELAKRLEMEVTLEIAGSIHLPDSSRQHVLAILKEALINAHRYSGTQHATVRLKTAGKDAALEVSDEGVGFDRRMVSQEGCYGLIIMEERAHVAGSQLDLDSVPGRGTRVTVHLPGAAL